MSDAAYFSTFSEPPLETYARRLKSIDRKKKKIERERTEKEREEKDDRERGKKQESRFYYTFGQNPFRHAILKKKAGLHYKICVSRLFWKWRTFIWKENLVDIFHISLICSNFPNYIYQNKYRSCVFNSVLR